MEKDINEQAILCPHYAEHSLCGLLAMTESRGFVTG
jgi:hypothetical protein